MEALTGAAVAALTIYDMCKALSHDIEIGQRAADRENRRQARLQARTASDDRPAPLYGLVLAGGHSTRMQRDKAALRYHGQTQLEWAMAFIEPYVDKAFRFGARRPGG